MSTTCETIYLDFYNQNLVTVTAKQYDTSSRYLNIVCTDHGKRVFLDKAHISAYIRYPKSDGTFIFNDLTVLDDGTIYVEMTQQMLAVAGKFNTDILITSLINVPATNLIDMDSVKDMGGSVISTMSFVLNIFSTSLDEIEIVSVPEYSALVNSLTRLAVTEKKMLDLEEELTENEETRKDNENTRISNENSRIEQEDIREKNEVTRKDNETTRISNETNRENLETERINEEEKRKQAEIKRQDDVIGEAFRIKNENERLQNESDRITAMEQNIEAWNQRVESLIDKTGVIMQTEKNVPLGVATLDENGNVTESQLSHIIQMINNLPTIHINDTVDDSIGKNGDILLVPITEE